MPSGELVGKYRLLKLLARGGMGEVYLARQEGLKGFSKTVVVKKILEGLSQERAFAEMFINEARLAALLTHPNLVQVFDLGEDPNGLYLAMEYVHGHSLRAIETQLQQCGQSMPLELAARVCEQALLGLHHAHRAVNDLGQPLNLVHRDVSPDNILVGYDGSVKVTDFGIAKASGMAMSRVTAAGAVKGKIAYMSPEQLQIEPLDGRSDVYALGVVLYELLAGTRPYGAQTDATLMQAIVQQSPRPLREVMPAIDPELEQVVHKALEKDRGNRFQSAADMAEALAPFARRLKGASEATAIHRLLVSLFGEDSAKPPSTQTHDNLPVVRTREANEARTTGRSTSSRGLPRLYDAGDAEPPKQAAVGPDDIKTKVEGPRLATPALPAVTARVPPRRSKVAYVPLLGAVVGLGAVTGVVVWMAKPATVPSPPPKPVVVARQQEPPQPDPPQASPPPPVPAQPPARELAKTGKVEIDVVPWGEIWFGKKNLGITPLDPIALPTGRQVLVVKNPELGVTRQVKVNVPPGGTARVRINLME